MSRKHWTFSLVAALLIAEACACALVAQETQAPPVSQRRGARESRGARGARGPATPATEPRPPRNPVRHEGFVEIAKRGNIDLLFVGDSITDLWPRRGKDTWDAHWVPLNVANFGISGDTAQGVLWRMQNGELEGFKAKLIVLMLGTNNISRNSTEEIAAGDRLIIEEFKKRQPQAKILLLGVFPRSANASSPARATIKDLNEKLAKLADNKQVFYMDIGEKFLESDGTLSTEVMADGLHPTAKGYQIWADAISDRVKELMK